ncbi:MAG: hypothetical protein ABR575_08515 [Actinomycetota bacterium]
MGLTGPVAAVVAAGVALAVISGSARGFDALAVVILGVVALVGALCIAVSRRAERGSVAPARCPRCRGIVSPHAPYCKHCGASL